MTKKSSRAPRTRGDSSENRGGAAPPEKGETSSKHKSFLPSGDEYIKCVNQAPKNKPRGSEPVKEWLQNWNSEWQGSDKPAKENSKEKCLSTFTIPD